LFVQKFLWPFNTYLHSLDAAAPNPIAVNVPNRQHTTQEYIDIRTTFLFLSVATDTYPRISTSQDKHLPSAPLENTIYLLISC
jgi:hypothetical protein